MSQHIKATGKTFDIVSTISECNNQLRWWCVDDSSFYTIFLLKISQIWQSAMIYLQWKKKVHTMII